MNGKDGFILYEWNTETKEFYFLGHKIDYVNNPSEWLKYLNDLVTENKELKSENQKYKEVIDKIKEEINNNKYYTGNTRRDIKTRKLIIEHIETALISKNKILEILKEVE